MADATSRTQSMEDSEDRAGSWLADPANQLAVLQPKPGQRSFQSALAASGLYPLRTEAVEVLQVNLGRRCNMTCTHCHVDAGPNRREMMSCHTAEACIDALRRSDIPTLDLTGGAPEMNPSFSWLVGQARRLGRHVIDRSNLTIFREPGFEHLPEFLAEHEVEIVASLPCYLEENVALQRGRRAFARSIDVLRQLNRLGYGRPESELRLTLVYNPIGPELPPPQATLEDTYRRELLTRYAIHFSRLIAITNMPISRFLSRLLETGAYESYMATLIAGYNSAAASEVMCRTTLSVDWRGRLYDCDFNQMLGLSIGKELPQEVGQFEPETLANRAVPTGQHCYGCTAGSGSGCGGQTTS